MTYLVEVDLTFSTAEFCNVPASSTEAHADAAVTTQIVNPLICAVKETFEMMLGCVPERTGLQLRESGALLHEVSAVVGISGRAKGSVCLSFAQPTALQMACRLLGSQVHRIDSEAADALGELINIVAGATKSKVNMGLNMGLPNVVHGVGYRVEFPTNSHPMRMEFESEAGPFIVDFGFVVRDYSVAAS